MKVYQEAVQSIVQLKSDVAGLQALETHQQDELTKVDSQLQVLAENEAKFNRLKFEVEQAKVESQEYFSLAAKEHLNADISGSGFSTIQVAQSAIVPMNPSFPNPLVILPAGIGVGLLFGFGLPIVRLMARRAQNIELRKAATSEGRSYMD